MQSLTELAPEYLTNLAKLDELLRHYQIVRQAEKFQQIRDKVKSKIKKVIEALRTHSCFAEIQEDIMNRVEKVFNPPKPKPAVKSSKPQANSSNNNKSDPMRKSAQSMSSFSNSNAGGSVKLNNDKKSASPVKKGASMHTQQFEKKSDSSSNNEWKGAESLKSVKVEAPQAKISSNVSQASDKSQNSQQKPVKPVISAVKFVEAQPVAEIKETSKKESSSKGMVSIISDAEVKTPGSLQSGRSGSSGNSQSLPLSISTINKVEQGSIQQANMSVLESQSVVSSSSTSFEKHQRKPSEDYSVISSSKQSEEGCEGDEVSENEVTEVVIQFLAKNRDNLNNALVFNDEIFDLMDENIDNQVYLFGVNKPSSKKITQLYACTIMKFMDEDTKIDDKFQKQIKDFNNNIRIPLGLIFKGATPMVIKPYHIRFLQVVTSPFPVILLVKNDECVEGTLCSFHESILDYIRTTPKKQLDQCQEQLHKKTYDLRYGKQNYPSGKNKVITKILYRKKSKNENVAPMAISISGNDCIRQEKHHFHYKLHAKFLPSIKNDFTIYYANSSNIMYGRRLFKEKQLDQLKKELMESPTKDLMMVNSSVMKQTSIIRKDYLQLLFETKSKREVFFFLALNSLTNKKIIVLTLKNDIDVETIKEQKDMQFKQFEKDTPITNYILTINKTNIKQYETLEQVVQIKAK